MSKISKLVRLFRLVKMFKILKNKDNLSAQFQNKLKISAGAERLALTGFMFAFFAHVCACLFMLIGTYFCNDDPDSWYNQKDVRNESIFDKYTYCIYFIITTMTTVGYGD